jgi:hypothetical protein
MLDERNELLAKLMATEDIDVQQNNVPTAYFDTKKRTLVLPNWKNLSQMETEMLIGHEIGHALYTPTNAWVAAIESFDGNKGVFKHVMNVIEDPRIERGVKKKYPGMRKIFYFGYEELFQRGIFTKDLDPSNLTLIDKLNFQFKVPGKVQFETDEKFWELVQKIEACETFSQVVALSKEIYALCEEEHNQAQQEDPGSEESEENEESSEGKPSPTKDSDPSVDKREGKGSEDSGVQKEESKETESESTSSKKFAEQYTPILQKKLDEFLSSNLEATPLRYMELPEPILDNILITNKELQNHLSQYEWSADCSYPTKYPTKYPTFGGDKEETEPETEEDDEVEAVDLSSIAASIKKFNKYYSASIAYYTKVFDMKKKATEYKNTLKFKTGKLDMNALTKYKFEDNIFLTTQVKQKGKNHGIVFYLDMSSSMIKVFNQTLTQLLEIVSFCRSCGIPVSVYGFADNIAVVEYLRNRGGKKTGGAHEREPQFKPIDGKSAYDSCFGLIEIFTPTMTNKEFVDTFELFLSKKWKYIYWFSLNGTPLAPAVNTLEAVVNRFRKITRAEIVNVVFLTDGGDTHGHNFYDICYNGVIYDKKKKNRVTSDYLKKKYEGTWMSRNSSYMVPAAILNLMKKRLQGVNVVNFYINSLAGSGLYSVEKKATMEFDEMYIVHPDAFNKEGSLSGSYCANVEELTNKFTQLSKKKQMKRTMINSFIEKIAK